MPDILSPPPNRPPRAARVPPFLFALIAAAAGWLAQGTLAFTGTDSERIGLLPWSTGATAVSIVAAAVVWWLARRGSSAAPLWLLLLIALPWLPAPWPPAVLLWTGPLGLLVWLAVTLCLLADAPWPSWPRPVRPQLAAGIAACLLGAMSFWQVSPSVPAGDEPHYLVIAQSLLKDGDVRIENNHRQRDYRAYVNGDLAPDFRVRGRNGEIYSIHAPGVPALIAPIFALGGYHAVVVFLLIMAGLTGALAWHLAWLVTGRADAAWFGWGSVVLSTTFLFHTFTVYPDGPGALAALTGVWALLRTDQEARGRSESVTPWLLHGAALAALPWMHTRFVVLAVGLGALILLRLGRTPNPLSKAGALIALPTLSAICWIGYFVKIYGTPDPSAPYGGEPGSFAFVPDGLAGLLFDQRFGLFAYAPVLLFAAGGIGVMLARREWRRHALELLFVVVPYLVLVTFVAMWWGGTSAPARFVMPILPWMAIPAAVMWARLAPHGSGRALALGALAFTAFASASLVFVDDGRMAYSVRESYARWHEWLSGSVDLSRGLPVWWRDRETPLFRGILVWGTCAAAGWFTVRRLERLAALRPRARFRTAVTLVAAAAGSIALSVTWRLEGVSGRAPATAQLAVLRRISSEHRLLGIDISRARVIPVDAVTSRLLIAPEFSAVPGGAGRNDRPLFAVPAVPAGTYRLRFPLRAAAGWIMIGIGRDQFALRTEPLASMKQPLEVTFPVDVRAIMVRADEDARRNVLGMTIEPVRVATRSERISPDYARRAVYYSGAIVYFMDDRSFPEPEAFWIGGARQASIALQPEAARPAAALQLRNGAVDNTVTVESGAWRDAFRLGPGEERRLEIPLDQARGATLVRFTTAAGFRPSDVDPKSRDDRFLGVWVKLVN